MIHLRDAAEWSSRAGKAIALTGAIALLLLMAAQSAQAQTVRIVALGASNTYGQAVGAGQAWPAKLEAMLRAKGYDAGVTVRGVTLGDAGMIAGTVDSAVPDGVKVVVYDTGGGNSRDRGIDPRAVRGQIEQRVRAHGAVPVFAAYNQILGPESPTNRAWIQGDTHHHFTAESHTRVAAALLPRVIAAIGRKK